MFYYGAQVASLLKDAELAFCAGAFVQYGVDVLDGTAAAKFIDHIVDEIEQLEGELAHGDFRFFAEIDELAFDTIASCPPFVFFDQGAPIDAITHIRGVKTMEFDDDSLSERGDGNGFFDFCSDIAHAEFQRAERGMRANVPPDFLAAIDAIEL